jgi:hypothetical protein
MDSLTRKQTWRPDLELNQDSEQCPALASPFRHRAPQGMMHARQLPTTEFGLYRKREGSSQDHPDFDFA